MAVETPQRCKHEKAVAMPKLEANTPTLYYCPTCGKSSMKQAELNAAKNEA
jgi:transcription elongation factor Elf1